MTTSLSNTTSAPSSLGSWLRTAALLFLVGALSYVASILGGALILRPQLVSPLWLGNVVLVAMLLLSRRSLRPLLLLSGLAAFLLFDLQEGVPARSIVWLLLSNSVEVLTATLCLSRAFDSVPRLNSIRSLAKYSFYAVFLAPFVGAFVGALATRGNYWESWKLAFFSEALGFLTLMPAILGWANKGLAWARKSRGDYLEAAVLFASLIFFGILAFAAPGSTSAPALLYSLVPFLLWAALRFGSTGVSTSMIVLAFLSIWGAVRGHGPFVGPGPIDDVLWMQLFLLFAAAPFMVLAVLVEEHNDSRRALKKSEEKFSIAFRECPSAFAVTRLKDDRYLEVNETFERLTGYRRDELLGRTPFEIGLWENPAHRKELVAQLQAEGKVRNEEVRFQTRDGSIRSCLTSAELIEIDGERCLLSLTSDITELKQAQETRLRHAAIVESSDDAIISEDLQGIILSWNAGACRIFGFSEAEAIGQPISILIPPELRDDQNKMRQLLRTGECIQHLETIRVTKEGKKIDVSLTISPVQDSSGRVAGFSKIARDISDRKRAEQTLRESEERFRLVANQAPVFIWMSGTNKLRNFCNQCWLDFTGRTMEQELGEGWAAGVHPEDMLLCLQTYSAAFDARVDFELEYRLKRFDGKYRWIVDHGVPRFESDGVFCGYIGSCVDITDRKLSEESLEELSGRLLTAQEEERTRIARELHDDFSQRLALQSIALTQLWKRLPATEVEERAKVRELLKRTQEMSSDMHSLSHQLHSSKLEHVGLVPALNGLCEEMTSKYRIQVEFTDREVSSEIPKDIALCLFRIVQEALGNVVKHSHAQHAQVELAGTKNEVRLRIVDAGVGFNPGQRSADAGIGLVSMRERLRLVGGRLSVQSAPMRGTEIIAEVPLAASGNGSRVNIVAAGGAKS